MNSIIAKKLKGRFQPIVLLRSNQKPENALEIAPGTRGRCMMDLFARVVAEGETAVFTKESCGCLGAVSALGFGNGYVNKNAPGLTDNYAALFANGLEDVENKEEYLKRTEKMSELDREKFIHGERLHPTKEKAYRWITEELPVYDFPERYAILKPLSLLEENETPHSVIFTINPIELSALITHTATITDGALETLTPPAASGCQAFGAYVFSQENKKNPRAVLGLLDLAARPHIREWIPDEYLTYSMTWDMFRQLEETAENGIFDGQMWKYLKGGKE